MNMENPGEISINMESVISRYLFPNPDDVEDFLLHHSKITIHTLHQKFHYSSKYYDPECVAIGPIHHDDEKLKKKEKAKRNYVKVIIKRTAERQKRNGVGVFHECIRYVQNNLEKIKECYSDEFGFEDEEFVKFMVIDGLFLLEMLQIISAKLDDGYLYKMVWEREKSACDLLIAENQIPFFILEGLFGLTTAREDGKTLIEICLDMLVRCKFQRDGLTIVQLNGCGGSPDDLLDLLSKSLRPNNLFEATVEKKSKSWWSRVKGVLSKPSVNCKDLQGIPKATELRRYGVYFEIGSSDRSFLDIKFSGNTLQIPWFKVSDSTELIFRNLIAKEQYGRVDGDFYITSYICFLSNLLATEKDVDYLCQKGIITNYLSSNDEVAKLFRNLNSDVVLTNRYKDLMVEVNEYYFTWWNYWWAALKIKYFEGPWTPILLVLGFIFFLFSQSNTAMNLYKFLTGNSSLSDLFHHGNGTAGNSTSGHSTLFF